MKLELESPTAQDQFLAGDFPQSQGFAEEADGRVSQMLKAGIKAAQEGSRAEARQMLLRVTDHQPENETAWLWLASISEYPEELLGFLNNVLRVNPDSERALEWAKATKSLMAKTLVQRGITASRENQKELARQFFEQAVEHDCENELAWLWLASVAETTEEKSSHLEKVLSINPENETALASLKSVRRQTAQNLLKKANVAAISGDHETARELLEELMKRASEMEEAWILKAYLSPSHDEKLECFERVLTLNPENETAQAGIDSLNALKQRELEAAAQRAHFENLQAGEMPPAGSESGETSDEAATKAEAQRAAEPQDSFAEQAVNQFIAEEQQLADEDEQDSPTQELDERYLESLKEETGFSFSAEEPPAPDFYFPDAEVEAPPVEFSASVEEASSEEFAPLEFFVETPENTVEAAEEEFQPAQNEFPETEPVENENYPFFTANLYPEGFEQKLAEGFFETEQEENLMEDSFEQNVEPQFGDFSPTFVEQNASQTPEPAQMFEPEALEMPQVPFEAMPVEVSEPQENHFPAEETSGEVRSDENVSEENFFAPEEAAANFAASDFAESSAVETKVQVEEPAPEPRQTPTHPEPFACPFCAATNEPQAFVCVSCRAVLTLSDVEMMLAYAEADKQMLETAVQNMEAEKQAREFDSSELTHLGMAHLNLKNLRQGFTYLQEAVNLNPNNVVLGSQVHSLALRLAEIEEHENKTPKPKSYTIMVVDDSPTVRKLISGKLEKCGHTVVLAVDGMDALAKINDTTPDLILLDITMPRLDGYQVCKLIRSNDATKNVPVVMISGRDGFFDKVRGRMAGSTGYITKPFGPDTLMRTIEAYFN